MYQGEQVCGKPRFGVAGENVRPEPIDSDVQAFRDGWNDRPVDRRPKDRLTRRENQMLGQLWIQAHHVFKGKAMKLAGDRQLADELMSALGRKFSNPKLFRRYDPATGIHGFQKFGCGMLRNILFHWLRDENADKRCKVFGVDCDPHQLISRPSSDRTPLAELECRDDRRAVRRALLLMPKNERRAMIIMFGFGGSLRTVQSRLGVSYQAAISLRKNAVESFCRRLSVSLLNDRMGVDVLERIQILIRQGLGQRIIIHRLGCNNGKILKEQQQLKADRFHGLFIKIDERAAWQKHAGMMATVQRRIRGKRRANHDHN